MELYVEVFGLIGGGLGFLISVPQLIRVLKSKSQVGVSIITWLLVFVSAFSWTLYGIRFPSFSQVLTNSIASCLSITLCFVLLRQRFGVWQRVLILLSLIVSSIVVVSFAPVYVMDVWIFATIWSRIPQTFSSYKSWRLARNTDVALGSFWLTVASGVAWILFGTLGNRPEVTIFSGTLSVLSLLVIFFETRAKHAAQLATSRNSARTP